MLKMIVNDFRLSLGKTLGSESVDVKLSLENKGTFICKIIKKLFLTIRNQER